ncbi:hypothetical protein G4B88_018494 [Cannabis sativa]|uniref:Uncharacterized protein n=1 Tax=Cannabis sativa TaxID=3483 RepID=A0A7J6HGF1_CANSA|nr:hypothetical protein G4B88_018494 [Cannabis sativa]
MRIPEDILQFRTERQRNNLKRSWILILQILEQTSSFDSKRDPYSKGVDPELLKASLASRGRSTTNKKQEDPKKDHTLSEIKLEEPPTVVNQGSLAVDPAQPEQQSKGEKTLKDAVKPKHKRKKKQSSTGGS